MRGLLVLLVLVAGCSFQVAPAGTSDGGLPDAAADGANGDDGAVDAPPIDAGPAELIVVIAASHDDALQDPDGTMNVAYGWVSLYSTNHWGALRFALAGIEKDATILEAYVEVIVDSTEEDSPSVVIKTALPPNSTGPLATNANISTRALGSSLVSWVANNIGAGAKRTPALTTLVQERVRDVGWTAGAHIVFVFDSQPSSGQFEFRQFDHPTLPAGSQAAKLTVRYLNP